MANNYLPTDYQTFIHASRYARWLPDEGRRESWIETVSRFSNFMQGHLDKNLGVVLPPETWRRMIYQERMRRVDDQIFTAFDFPDCGQVRAKRPVSTTPLQALNLMNSPFVVDQAEHLANRASMESGNNLKKSVARAFELIFSRKPSKDELQASLAVAKDRGLNIVCRALMNSNEFAFLP